PGGDVYQNEHHLTELRTAVQLADRRRPTAQRPEPEPKGQGAEPDQHIPRDDRRRQPPGSEAEPRALDEYRDQQQLVGRRIEDLAELGCPVEALGQMTDAYVTYRGRLAQD